ncbi:competence type IV pilus minor pilin ComGF [Bacillus sp. FJAT-44742]|uniref:competence type IV pilus minor pilin ComGF n=1 Tax=Bacillus sp. FJAT-44742 TaxID=2014005 RepID=UPI000C2315B6|nr:competence type IV pilus minor pilin ComGF [Bacillus sp. FJAT-44742]
MSIVPILNKGFTLIETLISLVIVTTIAAFLPLAISSLDGTGSIERMKSEQEKNIFFQQLRLDTKYTGTITTGIQRIELEEETDIITYELIGTNIVRKVNQKGYEIVLQHVSDFEAEMVGDGAKVVVTAESGVSGFVHIGPSQFEKGVHEGWISRAQ